MYRCSRFSACVSPTQKLHVVSRFLGRRLQSSKTALQINSVNEPENSLNGSLSSTRRVAPVVVEHVDGRARHISWSSTGELQKKWRQITAVDNSDGNETAISTRPSRFGNVGAWLRQMFLPTNYPQSVHKSYLPFHILQFFECGLATLVSVLCNQALLVSVGVSAEGSIFGAVAVQWIIKDGAGELAKLFFIRKSAPYFDSHPKTFDLMGEGIFLLGSGLQIASLLGPQTASHFLLCAAGGNVFKLIGHAIWFTTHIKFVRYFALQGNTGDVAAKTESHSSVAQLLGYASGAGLLAYSHTAPYLYSIFAVAVPIHLIITTWMLRLASFELLTVPRVSWLANSYVNSTRDASQPGVISLKDMDKGNKTGLFGEFYKTESDRVVKMTPRVEDVLTSSDPAIRESWDTCAASFNDEKYLLYPSQLGHSRTPLVSIFFSPSATSDDMLRAILQAAHLRHLLLSHPPKLNNLSSPAPSTLDKQDTRVLSAALEKSKRWTTRNFGQFKTDLERCGWRTDEIAFADHGRRVVWGDAARRGS